MAASILNHLTAMATSRLGLGLLLLMVISATDSNGCVITIRNNCPYTVTTCVQNADNPIDQYNLGSGATQALDFGSACNWEAGAIWASVSGQCAVAGTPNAATDRNKADLAEFTLGVDGQDNYDISNVNAYTIPLGITPTSIAGGETPNGLRCGSPDCTISDISAFCQPNNVLETQPSGALVCINTDGTAGQGPTDGTRQFKTACPEAYSYNFGDPTSLYTCTTGTNYDTVFCP